MNALQRQQIGQAFGRARNYDAHARVQKLVADRLAARIAAIDLPADPKVLEIGCGTGFLTEALIKRGIGGDWLITDIAPAMVERCRARVGESGQRRFAVLDGEYGLPEQGGFDLIVSSLAMQWFDDQEAALARMIQSLSPRGHCLFATLGAGTFEEWRAAHRAEGLEPGTRQFVDAEKLAAMLPGAQEMPALIELEVEQHDNALGFLRSLKGIGARTPASGHRPLSAAELRRVMARFGAMGSRVTYEVVTGHYRQQDSER